MHVRTWPEQGLWTWEDYLRLPDDGQRYEVIGGVLYASPSPDYSHQFTVAGLASSLYSFVLENDLGVVLTAPFDVLLPEIASPVQPDVLYLAEGNQPPADAENFVGVPDLVAEVVSLDTRRVDLQVKAAAYEAAGVSEYWIIDQDQHSVTVYALGHGTYREHGRFTQAETARSPLLQGFKVAVDQLFVG